MLAWFSTVAGEPGAADAERDVRGFALKFYKASEGRFKHQIMNRLTRRSVEFDFRGGPRRYRGRHFYFNSSSVQIDYRRPRQNAEMDLGRPHPRLSPT